MCIGPFSQQETIKSQHFPLKPLRPASRKDLSQLLLLVLKCFFALDLVLQFH